MAQTCDEARVGGQFEVRITGYDSRGEGLARLADGWLAVAGALPGELVRVRVVAKPLASAGSKQSGREERVEARLVEVIEASPKRRDPMCARDAICSGCQLRHMTIAEELTFKAETVVDAIEKFAGIERADQPAIELITVEPISRGDGFRIRTNLSYRRVAGGFELGLVSELSDHLIPMDECPAHTAPIRRLVSVLQKAFAKLKNLPWDERMAREVCEQAPDLQTTPGLDVVRVAAPLHGHGFVELVLTACNSLAGLAAALRNDALKELVDTLLTSLPEQVGLAVSCGEHRQFLKEPERIVLPLADQRLEVGYDDWFHANLPPADVMYESLLELLELSEKDRLLDLGCGIGTIALMVSDYVEKAVGVDINRHSIETARHNAVVNRCKNVEFVAGSWESGLRRLLGEGARFSVAAINPTNEPLGRRALAYLSKLGVERVVYLGPSPMSAGVDIGDLGELGFELDYLAAANLHPATYHGMLVGRLRWVGESGAVEVDGR